MLLCLFKESSLTLSHLNQAVLVWYRGLVFHEPCCRTFCTAVCFLQLIQTLMNLNALCILRVNHPGANSPPINSNNSPPFYSSIHINIWTASPPHNTIQLNLTLLIQTLLPEPLTLIPSCHSRCTSKISQLPYSLQMSMWYHIGLECDRPQATKLSCHSWRKENLQPVI